MDRAAAHGGAADSRNRAGRDFRYRLGKYFAGAKPVATREFQEPQTVVETAAEVLDRVRDDMAAPAPGPTAARAATAAGSTAGLRPRSERRLILQRRVLDLPRHWLADRPAEAPPRKRTGRSDGAAFASATGCLRSSAKQSEERMNSTEPVVAAVPWKHYSVLVVDDEPGMVSFIQRALESRCGVVEGADSVEAALPLVRRRLLRPDRARHRPPGRSGIDWLHELRDEGYAGDVVPMTAYADLDTASSPPASPTKSTTRWRSSKATSTSCGNSWGRRPSRWIREIKLIQEQVHRIRLIVAKLLQFARPRITSLPPNPSPRPSFPGQPGSGRAFACREPSPSTSTSTAVARSCATATNSSRCSST